jgi:choloylglycine hydrolase
MKRISLLLLLLISSTIAFGCTTFVLKTNNGLVFGRNLDWVSDNGVIVENKKNVTKTSLVFSPEKPIQWTSKYGSITFNQFGKEFPFGGINEKGLVVEIMLANAAYPLADERPAVNELQWIQYQLDNSGTIEDVINSDALLRISKIKQELHFLICDSTGSTAVIEFKNNKMVVYKGNDLPIPVLENDVYSKSVNYYKSKQSCRFTTAADMV